MQDATATVRVVPARAAFVERDVDAEPGAVDEGVEDLERAAGKHAMLAMHGVHGRHTVATPACTQDRSGARCASVSVIDPRFELELGARSTSACARSQLARRYATENTTSLGSRSAWMRVSKRSVEPSSEKRSFKVSVASSFE